MANETVEEIDYKFPRIMGTLYIQPDERIEKVYLGGRVVQPTEKGYPIDRPWKLRIKFKENFSGVIVAKGEYAV